MTGTSSKYGSSFKVRFQITSLPGNNIVQTVCVKYTNGRRDDSIAAYQNNWNLYVLKRLEVKMEREDSSKPIKQKKKSAFFKTIGQHNIHSVMTR
jgi:hypothetical protein